MLVTFIVTVIVSAIYELLALNTRFNIFGCRYQYNLKQPLFRKSFLGLPLMIPFMWAITKVLTNGLLGFLWIDLIFDPAAVKLRFWKFERKGLWFGVPLTNYIGWTIVWLTVEGVKWLLT